MLYYITAYKHLGLDILNRLVILIIRARVQCINTGFYLQIVKLALNNS
jgi:hypothetical protein